MKSTRAWWRDAVFYQVYPRSFSDSDGDGVGDLEGIRRRLGHLQWMGVDALWLSPFYPSPMVDFGYDVADYCDVDPLFGTLADFDRLLADAHARDIRVIVDWVPNHTSDAHPWFVESRSSRANPRRDWYVWRDGRPGGGLPNDWPGMFGGPAWTLDENTGQYYLHSFHERQPDLDWRNPEVRAAMHEVLRFWLDRGVDGFRIDVVHKIAKHPQLADQAEAAAGTRNDEDHPDVHHYLREVRSVLDGYADRMTVGEVFMLDAERIARYCRSGDELDLTFNLPLVYAPWSAETIGAAVDAFERSLGGDGWPTVTFSNHDVSRHASRFDHPLYGDLRARAAAVLLLTLRGTPFLYYGEEIGMRDITLGAEAMLDPLGRRVDPSLGRDPGRSPMQWDASEGAGFTTGRPWLPVGSVADGVNVAAERDDPRSLLGLYRDLIALRRQTPALRQGAYRRVETPAHVYAYERALESSRAWIAVNFSAERAEVARPGGAVLAGLRTSAGALPGPDDDRVVLEPAEAAVLVVG